MFHPLNFTESTQIVTEERNDWFFKQMPVRQRKGFSRTIQSAFRVEKK